LASVVAQEALGASTLLEAQKPNQIARHGCEIRSPNVNGVLGDERAQWPRCPAPIDRR
jgi:hypothetical protein